MNNDCFYKQAKHNKALLATEKIQLQDMSRRREENSLSFMEDLMVAERIQASLFYPGNKVRKILSKR